MEQERRRAPRFTFIASAEVFAETAGMRLAARISDNKVSLRSQGVAEVISDPAYG